MNVENSAAAGLYALPHRRMKLYRLVLGLLTVWRITHLLQAEDGPWDVAVRLRRAAGYGFWGKLLDCFYCLSLWVAAPLGFLLGRSWWERALLCPSLSAGASLWNKRLIPHLEFRRRHLLKIQRKRTTIVLRTKKRQISKQMPVQRVNNRVRG